MDTSDPNISFDNEGNCSNCNDALEIGKKIWHPDNFGSEIIRSIYSRVKNDGRNSEFDCVIGLSGGVDSSYLAYHSVKHGLRPLIVHVDCGWNSEQAVKNVENVVNRLGLELHTFVVDWEELKDLHRAFFLASLPDQDIPQDHAIFSALYSFAEKNNVKYVFGGQNFATESIMPEGWGHQAMDYKHLKAVHNRYGERKLKNYPHLSFFRRYVYYTFIKKMAIINPLNYIDYKKDEAIEILKNELGWQYYGGKHFESRFTRFFQSYYLPVKFNFDKRRAHLSSLIISGQICREEALEIMKTKPYQETEIEFDIEYVAKKLDWTVEEFRSVLNLPAARHTDFPNNNKLFSTGLSLKRKFTK